MLKKLSEKFPFHHKDTSHKIILYFAFPTPNPMETATLLNKWTNTVVKTE